MNAVDEYCIHFKQKLNDFLWKPMMDVHTKLNWYSFSLASHCENFVLIIVLLYFISFITVVQIYKYHIYIIQKSALWIIANMKVGAANSKRKKHERKINKRRKEIRQHLNGQKFNWKILSDCNDGMMPQMCEQTLKNLLWFYYFSHYCCCLLFMFTKCMYIHIYVYIYIIKAWWTVNCMSFSAPHKFHSYVT